MKRLFYLTILILITGCSKSDDRTDEVAVCADMDYAEFFIAEPNDCFLFEDPAMTFTFVGFINFTKSEFEEIPYAEIRARILIDDFSWEFPYTMYDDPEMEGISFSGFVNAGINENIYTVYFDEIEFTETETEFIFHRATIRLEKFEE